MFIDFECKIPKKLPDHLMKLLDEIENSYVNGDEATFDIGLCTLEPELKDAEMGGLIHVDDVYAVLRRYGILC